jgi:AAA+ ATPase superfamily predicted ATPase
MIPEGNFENYFTRVELEEYIRRRQSTPPNGKYTVVYGPKGVGKSELVDYIYAGQKSVLKLTVMSASSEDDIVRELTKHLIGRDAPFNISTGQFIEAIRRCQPAPTIVFRSLSKLLAADCKCIVIVSEANDAILEFGRDKSRERVIDVDEASKTEAAEVLARLKTNFTADDREYVFDNVGTNPKMLISLAEVVPERMDLNDFVDDMLASAEQDLLAFPHQQILKALKEKEDGVSPEYFGNLENKWSELCNPAYVAKDMKDYNCLIYRTDYSGLHSYVHSTPYRS